MFTAIVYQKLPYFINGISLPRKSQYTVFYSLGCLIHLTNTYFAIYLFIDLGIMLFLKMT